MKIVLMTDTFYPYIDGVVTFLKNISKELGKRGHKVLILAPKYDNSQEINLGKNVFIERIESLKLLNYKDFKFSKLKYKKVEKIVKEFSPDIIHIQTPAPMGIMGEMIARHNGISCIGTYHTYLPDFVQCIYPRNIFKNQKLKNNILKLKDKNDLLYILTKPIDIILKDKKRNYEKKQVLDKIIWTYTNSIYNKCDIITTPTNVLAKDLKKHKVKKPVFAISNGIHLENFNPKSNYDFKGKFLHVGRISFEKEVDILIKAFANISNKNISLDIYGDGPALKSLKMLVRTKNIENVFFKGKVAREKLPNIYKEHDVFLTASPIETQGIVALEAAASGLPLIGVDRLGIKEIIRNNENGYLVKVQDINGFSKAIEKMINNKENIEEMGKMSVLLSKEHDFYNIYDKFEDLYEYVIGLEKRKRRKLLNNSKNKN